MVVLRSGNELSLGFASPCGCFPRFGKLFGSFPLIVCLRWFVPAVPLRVCSACFPWRFMCALLLSPISSAVDANYFHLQ